MAEDGTVMVYNSTVITNPNTNPFSFKAGVAQMLRGGVIFEVSSIPQAKIAEEAGACAIIVSEPSRLGISRMIDLSLVKEIKRAVSVPIIARARVGHFVEAQILQAVYGK